MLSLEELCRLLNNRILSTYAIKPQSLRNENENEKPPNNNEWSLQIQCNAVIYKMHQTIPLQHQYVDGCWTLCLVALNLTIKRSVILKKKRKIIKWGSHSGRTCYCGCNYCTIGKNMQLFKFNIILELYSFICIVIGEDCLNIPLHSI